MGVLKTKAFTFWCSRCVKRLLVWGKDFSDALYALTDVNSWVYNAVCEQATCSTCTSKPVKIAVSGTVKHPKTIKHTAPVAEFVMEEGEHIKD